MHRICPFGVFNQVKKAPIGKENLDSAFGLTPEIPLGGGHVGLPGALQNPGLKVVQGVIFWCETRSSAEF